MSIAYLSFVFVNNVNGVSVGAEVVFVVEVIVGVKMGVSYFFNSKIGLIN